MDSIGFYDDNSVEYSKMTFGADMSASRDRFIGHLRPGSRILDLGCGSGRDSLAFSAMGFEVTPVDGSEGMCRMAEKNTGLKVRRLLFSELDYHGCFDGVWACSSLLHVPSKELPEIMTKVSEAMVPGGFFYLTFKKGDFEGERDGRYYTDMTFDSLNGLVKVCGMETVDIWESMQPDRNIVWINAILSNPLFRM